MDTRSYKAMFFDLDGTLLPMDLAEFLGRYFEELGKLLVKHGIDPQAYLHGLNEGMRAMGMQPEAGILNEDKFWKVFCEWMEQPREELEPPLMEFYDTTFDNVGDSCTKNPAAGEALEVLHAKGYKLYLTTMPMFPPIGAENRLAWAGCKRELFERITTYDNSTATKPHLEFFKENLAASGFAAEEVLMVGNNTIEDLSAMKLGMDGYLVTDCMIDPTGEFDLESVKHGSLEDFLAFAKSLPECE